MQHYLMKCIITKKSTDFKFLIHSVLHIVVIKCLFGAANSFHHPIAQTHPINNITTQKGQLSRWVQAGVHLLG